MSKKAKIVLIVSICVVAAIVGLVYFGQKNNQNLPAVETETATSDDIYAPSTTALSEETPSGSVSQSATIGQTATTKTPTSNTTVISVIQPTATISSKPVKLVELTNKDQPTVTPYPNSGYFDYTRQEPGKTVDVIIKEEDYQKLQTGDVCEMAGINDSWNDPFSKILCSVMRFGTDQILAPLNSLICNLQTSALNLNYNSTITSQLSGTKCQIIDR